MLKNSFKRTHSYFNLFLSFESFGFLYGGFAKSAILPFHGFCFQINGKYGKKIRTKGKKAEDAL